MCALARTREFQSSFSNEKTKHVILEEKRNGLIGKRRPLLTSFQRIFETSKKLRSDFRTAVSLTNRLHRESIEKDNTKSCIGLLLPVLQGGGEKIG